MYGDPMGAAFWLLVAVCVCVITIFALGKIWRPDEPKPAPPPPAVKPLARTAQVILAYNNSKFPLGIPVITNPIKGTAIHRITEAQAQRSGDLIDAACANGAYDLTMLLAELGVESWIDPNCLNKNEGPGESNEGNKLGQAGWDVGLAQLKAGLLVGNSGIKTVADALAFALDPMRAIPYHVHTMQMLVVWAKAIIAKGDSGIDYRFSDPRLLATCAYNFGRTGVLDEYYYKGTFPDGGKNPDGTTRSVHGLSVMNDEAYFSKQLGVPSIFADLKAPQ